LAVATACVGHGGGPVSAALQLDHEPVAHPHNDVSNAPIQRSPVISRLIGTERHDNPIANLDCLLDSPHESACEVALHDLEDHLAVLAYLTVLDAEPLRLWVKRPFQDAQIPFSIHRLPGPVQQLYAGALAHAVILSDRIGS
jgi:hypothetical protein